MTEYPYGQRDLFAEPETYFFAKCHQRDYLAAWRASRDRFLTGLVAPARQHAVGASHRPALPGSFALAERLTVALEELRRGVMDTADFASAIEPFVVKYEVFKRLFEHYSADGKRDPGSPPASLATYVLFAQCLAALAQQTGSLKHLSTLLKLCDALASQTPASFSAADAQALSNVIETERSLVERLALQCAA